MRYHAIEVSKDFPIKTTDLLLIRSANGVERYRVQHALDQRTWRLKRENNPRHQQLCPPPMSMETFRKWYGGVE